MPYLIPRAHVSFGQRQDTELWNDQFPDSNQLHDFVFCFHGACVPWFTKWHACAEKPELLKSWGRLKSGN